MVDVLIKTGAPVELRHEYGMSPLSQLTYAPSKYRLHIARYLLKNGADINRKDFVGRTPIFQAVGDYKTFKYLYDKGAKIDVVDDRGRNLLHWATGRSNKDKDVVNFLIEKGLRL